MFQQRIQLQREEPRSRWSIPCCSSFRTRGIQLPEDDSDHEEEQEQIAPFHIESTHFLQHPANLSRNPFARVDEQPEPPKIVLPSQEEQLIEVTEQESSRQKYENEPDWTELHQAASAAADADAASDDDDDKSDEQSFEEETIVTEEEIPKKQEKIPQIEREVLHLLPLPQLSNELPPTMIHKKPSFEKSMYGEQPLMSTTSRPNNTSRFSRFSMTEQDFLALKKQETDAATAAAAAATTAASAAVTTTASASTASTAATPISIETPTETPIMTDPLQATHARKSSIVSNAAQSILGDKLDDFTEKLAFIKKNIIMNQDSDDEEEADNAEETLRKIALLKQDPSTTTVSSDMAGPGTRTLHRRTSSLMDVAPTLARFMNQISEDFSALAGPESQRTAVPEEEDDDGEELFDFTKVIEIGKNMRSFSEGFVGNGIRILNDVATRIKTNTDEEDQEEDVKEEEGNWINDSYI